MIYPAEFLSTELRDVIKSVGRKCRSKMSNPLIVTEPINLIILGFGNYG